MISIAIAHCCCCFLLLFQIFHIFTFTEKTPWQPSLGGTRGVGLRGGPRPGLRPAGLAAQGLVGGHGPLGVHGVHGPLEVDDDGGGREFLTCIVEDLCVGVKDIIL